MDFFSQQQHARGLTRRLVALFALALAAIVAAVDGIVLIGFELHRHLRVSNEPPHAGHMPFIVVSLVVLGGIVLASLYRMLSLSSGGKAVAEAVGAQRVSKDTADPQLRRLRNVVEEMAIASGIPVPAVYVMPEESAINAFAAGFSHGDAAVCVTQGCLDQLNRDELEGVVAHEFSHVLNGDMRLSIWVMGLLFGIHALAVLGEWLCTDDDEHVSRRVHSANLLGLALLGIGSVGYFFGQLIQAAVARSRESLADASAVQFTRQADGLAGALKKTATYGARLGIGNRREIAHMLFNPSESLHPLMATHPPLIERIRELEPGFNEADLEQLELAADQDDSVDESASAERCGERLGAENDWSGSSRSVPATPAADASPGPYATQQRPSVSPNSRRIPEALRAATQHPESAIVVALALAQSASAEMAPRQQHVVAMAFGDDLAREVQRMSSNLKQQPAPLFTPLCILTSDTLAQLLEGRRQTLRETLDELLRQPDQVNFHSYCAALLLRARLRMLPRAATETDNKLHAYREDFALVCAVIACHGSTDEAQARRAWLRGMQQALPGDTLAWKALPFSWHAPFEHALDRLDTLNSVAKELVVQGLLTAVKADGELNAEESALLHAVCASLNCPMPEVALTKV